jgi:hypothetical protein
VKHLMPAFEILAEGKKAPIMSKFINCQMNFELKVDLKWKAKFIMGRHMTNLPSSITYSSIIIHDSVRLTFLIAALNDLDIITPSNIRNTYLNAPTMERVHTICGLEFGARSSCWTCGCNPKISLPDQIQWSSMVFHVFGVSLFT